MSQCRKMSTVLQERLLLSISIVLIPYVDLVSGIRWTSLAGPKYDEQQENHTEMASGPVLYSK